MSGETHSCLSPSLQSGAWGYCHPTETSYKRYVVRKQVKAKNTTSDTPEYIYNIPVSRPFPASFPDGLGMRLALFQAIPSFHTGWGSGTGTLHSARLQPFSCAHNYCPGLPPQKTRYSVIVFGSASTSRTISSVE